MRKSAEQSLATYLTGLGDNKNFKKINVAMFGRRFFCKKKRASIRGSLELRIAGSMKKIIFIKYNKC